MGSAMRREQRAALPKFCIIGFEVLSGAENEALAHFSKEMNRVVF
jgi:hypothetical protein